MCFLIILIINLNIFLVFACQCSMLISLSNVPNLLKNGHFPILSLFWWPFLLAHLSRRLKVSYSDWSSFVLRPFVGNLLLQTTSNPEPLVQIILNLDRWFRKRYYLKLLKVLHMKVSNNALYQNCINSSAPTKTRAGRAPDKKYFK